MIHSLGNINSPLLEPPSSPFIGSGGTHSVLGNLDDNDREDLTSLARNSFSKGYMLFEKRKNINMTCSDSDSVPPSPSSAPPLKKSPRFSSRKSPSSPSADFTTTSVADKRYTVPQHQQLQQQQWKNCKTAAPRIAVPILIRRSESPGNKRMLPKIFTRLTTTLIRQMIATIPYLLLLLMLLLR